MSIYKIIIPFALALSAQIAAAQSIVVRDNSTTSLRVSMIAADTNNQDYPLEKHRWTQAYQNNGHELRLESKIESPTAIHHHYQHYLHGAPVHSSQLQIHVFREGGQILVQNSLLPSTLVTYAETSKNNTWLVDQKGGYHLGTNEVGNSGQRPTKYVKVDGQKYEEHFQKLYYNGPDSLVKAQVFLVNPVNTAEKDYGGAFVDKKDSTNPSLDSQLRVVEMRVNYRNDTFFIGNDRFQFRNVIDPSLPNVYSLNDSFFFNRQDDEFEEVNAFFHLNNYAQYLTGLGYEKLLYDTLVVDANAGQADASAFDPMPNPKTLEFGLGGVDDAEDGEVVIHELIHSLSTKASPLTVKGNDRRAMEEGNCDYLASSYSMSYTRYNAWKVFAWDGHNEYWGGFVNNSPKNYKTDRTGFRDHDREIWSSALMCIHEKLGRGTTDSLVLEHFYYQAVNMTMPEMAKVILLIDTLQNNGANNWAIKTCFYDQGILTAGTVPEVHYSEIRILNSLAFAQGTGKLEILTPSRTNFSVELISIDGQTHFQSNSATGTIELNPMDFKAGNYVLRIIEDDRVWTYKVIRF